MNWGMGAGCWALIRGFWVGSGVLWGGWGVFTLGVMITGDISETLLL